MSFTAKIFMRFDYLFIMKMSCLISVAFDWMSLSSVLAACLFVYISLSLSLFHPHPLFCCCQSISFFFLFIQLQFLLLIRPFDCIVLFLPSHFIRADMKHSIIVSRISFGKLVRYDMAWQSIANIDNFPIFFSFAANGCCHWFDLFLLLSLHICNLRAGYTISELIGNLTSFP